MAKNSESNADPTALTVQQTAELLTKAAKQKVTTENVQQDIDDGAPTNGDGTIHLVNYTAWLASQVD